MYKELLKLSDKKTNHLIKNWAKGLRDTSAEKAADEHVRRRATSQVIAETQVETVTRYRACLLARPGPGPGP